MSDNPFYVVWQITCLRPPNSTHAKNFIVIDSEGDPKFCCDACGVEGSHLPVVTDIVESECWRCKGKGKITPKYSSDGKEISCPGCEGTGIHKNSHIRKLVGRVYEKDIIELANKDPQGWR
jgi:hypothetical protein